MKHDADLPAPQAEVGQQRVGGDWIAVKQPGIDEFAQAGGGLQWIHLDAERAAAGSIGKSDAHRCLTPGLLRPMGATAFAIDDVRMASTTACVARTRCAPAAGGVAESVSRGFT